MPKYAYSPDTQELIRTETPSDWMGLTDVAPPTFDPATAGCFWRGTAWEIVVAVAAVPSNEDIQREIAQMEAQAMLPRVTREFMLGLMQAQFTPDQLAGNIGYTKVKALDDQIHEKRSQIK